MKCWRCGAGLTPGAAFCNACGAKQSQGVPNQRHGPVHGTPPTGAGGNNSGMILTAFAAVCTAVCGGLAVRSLYYALRTAFHIRWYGLLTMIRIMCLNGLSAAMLALMAVSCALIAFKRTTQNSDGLLVFLAGSGAGFLVIKLLAMLVNIVSYFSGIGGYAGNFAKSVAGVVVAVAGVYAIERFVLGEFPLAGKSVEDLKMDMLAALDSIQQTAGQVGAQAQQAAQNAKAAQQARAAQQAQYNQRNPYQQNPYGNQTTPQGYYHLKTDRSLIAYILLTFITCGIYSWYFIYTLARDVNTACDGDGKNTAGLLKLILLSFITCGFYTWYWYYALGNRLAENAPRYELHFQENGTTVLLWMLLGSLLCGIGALVGLHIIIKNTNAICGAYNNQRGF